MWCEQAKVAALHLIFQFALRSGGNQIPRDLNISDTSNFDKKGSFPTCHLELCFLQSSVLQPLTKRTAGGSPFCTRSCPSALFNNL